MWCSPLHLELPAFAGGDNYDAMADKEGKGPSYFGFVRDTRGSAIIGAQVVLQPKVGGPVVLKTNAIGLYRSHISKDVRPADVEISCAKDGYKQSRRRASLRLRARPISRPTAR